MKHPIIRIALFILEANIVVLTILWGMALFTGQPQPSWNTLTISHFTVAAILLLPLILGGEVILVGGSALLGAVTIFIQRESALRRSMVAGLIIAVYQLVEALVFLQCSWLEAIYLVAGLMIFGLAWYLRMTEYHGWTMKRERAHLYIGRVLQRSPLHPRTNWIGVHSIFCQGSAATGRNLKSCGLWLRTNPPYIERKEEETSDEHACLCSHPLWWS